MPLFLCDFDCKIHFLYYLGDLRKNVEALKSDGEAYKSDRKAVNNDGKV